ncbi:MAG TPA: hypothetical protein VGR60_00405 [Gemmatimonadales bacterium]|nr:hypothetical protein [Gemmatimonadales bacterium]
MPGCPLHFACFVDDLASTRRFHGDLMVCDDGRGSETWPVEQMPTFLPDPGDNALGSKSFRHPERIVAA